ncbi:MAG TPA: hypothetical protein VL020_00720 [Pseudomonadales bacterium]|nr:hypothetical protein [Pseudomonadales bacterium]
MTIQLELDFLSTYAFKACEDLYAFAVSFASFSTTTDALKPKFYTRYYELQRQAMDLKGHAFLNGYIGLDDFMYLHDLILESSDLYWGV